MIPVAVFEEGSAARARGGRDQAGLEAALQPEEDRQRHLQSNPEEVCSKGEPGLTARRLVWT